jgi:hypothetical protein
MYVSSTVYLAPEHQAKIDPVQPFTGKALPIMSRLNHSNRTQTITASDIKTGQIRIPSRNTSATKSILPGDKATVKVILLGRKFTCKWDPRMGPDRERSGVIRIGRQIEAVAHAGDVFIVSKTEAGEYLIK